MFYHMEAPGVSSKTLEVITKRVTWSDGTMRRARPDLALDKKYSIIPLTWLCNAYAYFFLFIAYSRVAKISPM